MIPKRYYVVECPKCNKLSIYHPTSKDYKKWKKKCPYCKTTFFIYPPNDISRIRGVFDNPFEAARYIKKLRGKADGLFKYIS